MQYTTTCNPRFVVSEPDAEEYGCHNTQTPDKFKHFNVQLMHTTLKT
jgi:hypothetical protein